MWCLRPAVGHRSRRILAAVITGDISGKSFDAQVQSVGPFTTGDSAKSGTDPGDAPSGSPVIATTTEPAPGDWTGKDVRIVITLSEASSNSLVVPETALSSRSKGTDYVTVSEGKSYPGHVTPSR